MQFFGFYVPELLGEIYRQIMEIGIIQIEDFVAGGTEEYGNLC